MPDKTIQSNNFENALIELRSRNQDYKQKVGEQVLHQSGLSESNTVNALHDTPTHSKASIAQAIYDNTNKEQVKYAASWFGLYTNTPSTLIFHADEQGPDSLYKFHMTGKGNDIRKQLDGAGIKQRVLIPSKDGFHIIIHDQGRKNRNNVASLTKSLGLIPEETEGTSEFIGGKDEKEARANYRENIKNYEGHVNAPNSQ